MRGITITIMEKIIKRYGPEEIYNATESAVKRICELRSSFIPYEVIDYIDEHTPVPVLGADPLAVRHAAYVEAAIFMLYRDGAIWLNKTTNKYELSTVL